MEGQCMPIFEQLMQIYQSGHVLGMTWRGLEREMGGVNAVDRRAETISLMRKRLVALTPRVRSADYKAVDLMLDTLDQFNRGHRPVAPNMIEGPLAGMIIHAVADCECVKAEGAVFGTEGERRLR